MNRWKHLHPFPDAEKQVDWKAAPKLLIHFTLTESIPKINENMERGWRLLKLFA